MHCEKCRRRCTARSVDVALLYFWHLQKAKWERKYEKRTLLFYDSRRIMQPVAYRWPQSTQATKSIKTHSSASTVSCVWFMINVVCSFSRCSCLLQKASLVGSESLLFSLFSGSGECAEGNQIKDFVRVINFICFPHRHAPKIHEARRKRKKRGFRLIS